MNGTKTTAFLSLIFTPPPPPPQAKRMVWKHYKKAWLFQNFFLWFFLDLSLNVLQMFPFAAKKTKILEKM